MKPVNKTRRTVEHSGTLDETRVFKKNARKIIRLQAKRSSRKADRAHSKIVVRKDHDLYEPETDYRWEYVLGDSTSPRIMRVRISEFTRLPWWTLLGLVRYQDNNWVWYR